MSNKNKQFIVTGIGTDIGKTVVSAIITQALDAFYWKPIQAGELENSDSIKVQNWTTDSVTILPEVFQLSQPMSPHAAAEIDGVEIAKEALQLPLVEGNLIVEGAGGLMVPLNKKGLLLIDLFEEWNLPVIVVSRHYVGSINHTLLTFEALKNRKINIEGIIFVGDKNEATESFILNYTDLKMIARIPLTNKVNTEFIQNQARILKEANVL
jgi:dethiobiotin synthetase